MHAGHEPIPATANDMRMREDTTAVQDSFEVLAQKVSAGRQAKQAPSARQAQRRLLHGTTPHAAAVNQAQQHPHPLRSVNAPGTHKCPWQAVHPQD